MKDTEMILLQLTGRALFGARTDFEPEGVDWADLYAECSSQALTILIWDALTEEERAGLPEEISHRWERDAMMHVMTNEELLYEQEQAVGSLADAGIPCVILKGSSAAAYYPDPSLRSMGDIDLLVKPEQQMEAISILQAHGYGEARGDQLHCHMEISKGRSTIEVHREPNGLSTNENARSRLKIRCFFDDALNKRQFVGGIPVLADDQQAVSLLLHKIGHFLSSGLGLRQLCDWAVFVERRLDESLWRELEPKLAEFGILRFTEVITKVCVDYLQLPQSAAPWCMEYDGGISRRVIEKIMREANFGVKTNKYGERLFSNPNTPGRLTSLARVLPSACRDHWPVCDRYPILMPVAPFVLLARYLRQHRNGERPQLNLIRQYRQGGENQQLYRELRPFIIDDEKRT